MRELERPPASAASSTGRPRRLAVIGAGRLGTVLAAGLRAAGVEVAGPLGRGQAPAPDLEAVLLCVPDGAIAEVAAAVAPGPLLGHASGASGLGVLGARPGFSLHPLMTLTPGADPRRLRGAWAAVEGTDARAAGYATALAAALGLRPVAVAPADRAAYHAAASIAANFLVTVEAFAGELGESAGLPRDALVPLVQAAVQSWATDGPARALTGPVARGDAGTVAAQRAAVAERLPDRLALFDALLTATERLAGAARPAPEPVAC